VCVCVCVHVLCCADVLVDIRLFTMHMATVGAYGQGGFSNLSTNPRPSWQEQEVDDYIAAMKSMHINHCALHYQV